MEKVVTDKASKSQQRDHRQGLLSKIWNIFWKIISVLIISLIFSIIFEWIGITWFWSSEGWLHSKTMMLSEMQWFSNNFTQSILHTSPVILVQKIVELAHQYLFIKSGLLEWLNTRHQPNTFSYTIYFYARSYIESVVYVTTTFIIRLLIIFFTLPLFALSAIVGLTDGLVRRDLRRFGFGYESSFVYHHAKRTIIPILIGTWLIYLSIPFSIYPNIILIPAAFFMGLAISIMAGSFKKYL